MSYSIEQRDEQLVETTAAIRYHLSFPFAAQHLVSIVMEIDTDAAEIVLALPNWIPGSYKIRDFVSNQGDFSVSTGDGTAIVHEWIATNRVRIATLGAGTIRVSYSYWGHERTVRMSHINRFHAFVNPANCLMMVEGRMDEIHHVTIEHPWKHVSTSLSPVREKTWGALNYDILIDSPIEIGDHVVEVYERHGATHEIAITTGNDAGHDTAWLVEQTKSIVDRAVEMWGELPYDRYVFIIQLLPGQYGGLEHARSSVNMFDSESFADKEKSVKLLALLCHEYFHLWNVKRIRPIELGPFDYNSENYTRMLWLAEGVTSYYDDLMAYRCGFHSRDEYLRTIGKENLSRLLDVPGRRVMSIKDSSFLSWVKLYMPTADSGNRFPSYYLKGGIIFMLLDMTIIAESNGARSLDDGMRALWARYRKDPSIGVTEEEFISIVSEATGVDIASTLRGWLDSTDELPIAEVVARLGLEWREKAKGGDSRFGADLDFQSLASDRWTGMALEENKGLVKVARVMRDSPAEAAGIGADDELIAVDGARITSAKGWELIMKRGAEEFRVMLASEGRIYETTIRPIERLGRELVERDDATDDALRLLDRWLARS